MRLLPETPREAFALWQTMAEDFQPILGVLLDGDCGPHITLGSWEGWGLLPTFLTSWNMSPRMATLPDQAVGHPQAARHGCPLSMRTDTLGIAVALCHGEALLSLG